MYQILRRNERWFGGAECKTATTQQNPEMKPRPPVQNSVTPTRTRYQSTLHFSAAGRQCSQIDHQRRTMRRGRRPSPEPRRRLPILGNGGRDQQDDDDRTDDDDTPMDEDDQQVLVQDLERRIRRQQENMLTAFRVLCRFAGAATILVAVLETWTTTVDDSPSSWRRLSLCWLHAALSCLTHLALPSSSILWGRSTEPIDSAAAGGGVGYASVAVIVGFVLVFHAIVVTFSRYIWDDPKTGWGLGIANLLTCAVAAALLWDRSDSHRALRDLNDARYKHKTL